MADSDPIKKVRLAKKSVVALLTQEGRPAWLRSVGIGKTSDGQIAVVVGVPELTKEIHKLVPTEAGGVPVMLRVIPGDIRKRHSVLGEAPVDGVEGLPAGLRSKARRVERVVAPIAPKLYTGLKRVRNVPPGVSPAGVPLAAAKAAAAKASGAGGGAKPDGTEGWTAALQVKKSRRQRRLEKIIARSKRIQPGIEGKEQLYTGARQSEDAVTAEPSAAEFDAVVRLKEMLDAAKHGDSFEVMGDAEANELRRARLRPPTSVGGSCCETCKQGAGAACESEAFGGVIGETAGVVTNEEINTHNAAVTTLNAEVRDVQQKTAGNPGGWANERFKEDKWDPYVVEWQAFAADTAPAAWLGAAALAYWMSGRRDAFARFKLRYSDLREEWVKLGNATVAPKVDPAGPSGLAGKAGDAITSTLETVLTYGLLGGAAYLAFTFLSARAGSGGLGSVGMKRLSR